MFADDHLPPHFHAKYSEFEALINIDTGDVVKGEMPIKQLRLIQAWLEIHREELNRNYLSLNSDVQTFHKIKPLE